MDSDRPKKLGYCEECGDSLWEGIDHKCDNEQKLIDLKKVSPLVSQMIGALVLADLEFSGRTGKEDPGRAKAAVRRILRKMGLSPDDVFFYTIQTTAESCPPTTWD